MVRKFIKLTNQQGRCPVCGNSIHNYGAQDIDVDYISFEWKCSCGADGTEYYKTTFDGHSRIKFKDNGQTNIIDTLEDIVGIDDEDVVEYDFVVDEE